MTNEQILAIDVGTQSVRALVFDPQGEMVARAQVHIEPYFSVKPGWAEQHVSVFWDAVGEACRRALAMDGVRVDAIVCATLTTQRGTVVNVDASGEPLRPAISWLDQRVTAVEDLPQLKGWWPFLFRLARATQTVRYVMQQTEANWLAAHQPEVMADTHKYLLLSGYLTYRLTGRYVDSIGAQVGYIPFDYKKLDWCGDNDWKWQGITVERHQLPELVPPGGTLGQISGQAARHTGLPEGLPLLAAAADKACEIIGSGCVEPHLGAISYGTTATINTTHQKYIEVIPLIPPYPSAVPGRYSLEIQIFRGYWMVNWFKQQFGHREMRIAEERSIAPEALFDELVREIPPGSEGLILQPYWTPGIRVPGPEARGSIIGFSDVHTRAHIYRAILEGIAYALREATTRAEKRSGVPVTELRVSGGGSQSDAAMQLTADIFNLPAARPHTYETSGLGAAIDAAAGLGLHGDFDTAVKAMVRLRDVFEPDPATHRIYDGLYQNIYRKMYDRLRPLYVQMQETAW
ncbi:MAG: FGGY-family carbohydrate kinase [Chloroflexota bacterium]